MNEQGIISSGLTYYVQGIVMQKKGPAFVTAFSPGYHKTVITTKSGNQGERFTKKFSFQSQDLGLRRMVYLIIKELSPSADEVIIVTSSLMKDTPTSNINNTFCSRYSTNLVD